MAGQKLNLRKQRFVAEYMRNGGNGVQAAITAGYAPNNARTRAWRLTNQDEAVMAEIERAQKELAERTDYGAEQAMLELGDAIEFARKKDQATAMVRAIELRMKMAGLLNDKLDVNVSGRVDVLGAVLEAKQRAGVLIEDDDVIEGELADETDIFD